jgi:tetratricopeptide (TPR) repeat protein
VGRSFGHRGIEQVVLHNAVREAQRGHRLAGYPARVFVSYRWEGAEHHAWVERMALALREAGYDVTLDQWEPEVTTLAAVPGLVSRIVRSHVVLVVVSRGYVDAVAGTEKRGGSIVDGWVFDEYQLLRSTQEAGMCDVVLVYRDGSGLPGTQRRDRVVDARSAAEPPAHLPDVIGHSRLRLSEEQLSRLVAFEQIVGRALMDGDLATVQARLEADADLAHTAEYLLAYGQACALLGRADTAREAVEGALAKSRDVTTTLAAADVLNTAGLHREALRLLVPLAADGVAPARTHFLLGNTLDDADSLEAAVNHLRWAVHNGENPVARAVLGYALFRSGWAADAEQALRAALRLDPSSTMALENLDLLLRATDRPRDADKLRATARSHGVRGRPVPEAAVEERRAWLAMDRSRPGADRFGCPTCRATYDVRDGRDWICGDCASLYEGRPFHCPYCGNDGVVPVALLTGSPVDGVVGCPVCTTGHLVAEVPTPS